MPMKRVLEGGGTFDPKAVAIRLEALNGIVAKLDWRQSPTGRRLQKSSLSLRSVTRTWTLQSSAMTLSP
jgi:hypothetical protein